MALGASAACASCDRDEDTRPASRVEAQRAPSTGTGTREIDPINEGQPPITNGHGNPEPLGGARSTTMRR